MIKENYSEWTDPNVDNGMMTKVWGPPGWLFLNCVSFGYPYKINNSNPLHKNKKQDYKNFFYFLGKVMPCKYCRDSYMDFIKENPIDNSLNSRNDLTKWLYNIHNKINNKLGVPECNIPNFNIVKDIYESYRAKCKKTTKDERENNLAKGCVTPADGTARKCFLKIIECKKGDVTRRKNSQTYNIDDTDYLLVKKNLIILTIIIFIMLVIFCIKIFL